MAAADGATITTSEMPTTRKTAKKLRQPIEAFDQQTMRDFELWLSHEKGRMAMDASRRAHLRAVLQPDYQPCR